MMHSQRKPVATRRLPAALAITLGAAMLSAGCAKEDTDPRDFSTSGNREADQRAEQRIARDQQISGGDSGSTGGEVEKKLTLYERLGGEKGITAIVDDFVERVISDPRVNWERNGIQRGGFSIYRNQTVEWKPSPENKAKLKKHLVQFIALSSGGPAKYEGQDMKQAHADMKITNTEFDASVGDLKQSLDKLQVPTQEQKELLQIIESTRPQIASER